jgi:hypothetical protein
VTSLLKKLKSVLLLYSHIGLSVGHVGIFDDTHIACFVLVKTPCILSWGLVGASQPHVGASHPHGGINNSNLMLSLVKGSLK